MTPTTIWVTFTQERVHRWPNAPDSNLESYLRNTHRHLFHVRVEVEVDHNDRDVSFEQLRHEAETAFVEAVPFASTMSCEHMAVALADLLQLFKLVSVEVSEDGESGAIWRPYTP